MPVILDPQCYDLWLDPRTTDPSVVSEFLKRFDTRLMTCFPVSSRVNRTANDDAECAAPEEIVRPQGSLFSWEIRESKTQKQERNNSAEDITKQILRASWLAVYRPIPRFAAFHRSPVGEGRNAGSSCGPECGCELGRVESMVTTNLRRGRGRSCHYSQF